MSSVSSKHFDWNAVVDYAGRYAHELPATQYELPGITEELHPLPNGGAADGVRVAVVPLWHAIVTARVNVDTNDHGGLAAAQRRLDAALEEIATVYPVAPAGLIPQIAWGLPYFERYIPQPLLGEHFPKSVRAGSEGQSALVETIRFPRDPENLAIEHHDVCFHFKSDFKAHIDEVLRALFTPGAGVLNGIAVSHAFVGDLFTLTTVRRGFAGKGMPRRIGLSLGIPGAERIPRGAMLFMGFTSSHVDGLAAGNLASYETLPGWTDCRPGDYMAGGTSMHLSHIGIELERWYGLDHPGRLHRMFNPRRTEDEEILTPDQSPATAVTEAERDEDVAKFGLVGHNEQMQPLSRVQADTTTAYGQQIARASTFFLRQDFNTAENPFAFSLEDPISPRPRAGVHFIGMGPSAQHFELMRLEMDSVGLAERYKLRGENVGFTDFLKTTHRQNFCLPPRAHRSFPFAELL